MRDASKPVPPHSVHQYAFSSMAPLTFDFQSPLLLLCADSAQFLSAVFLHPAQGQRRVSFL